MRIIRGLLLVIAAAGLPLAASSPASAQREGLPQRQVCRTAPLGNNTLPGVTNNFEAGFVSTGSAPVKLTIQLCTMGGSCSSAGFGCVDTALTAGRGCSIDPQAGDQPHYAKFILKPTGGGTVGGEGSLRFIAEDGVNSAAVQTTCSGPPEKAPATED